MKDTYLLRTTTLAGSFLVATTFSTLVASQAEKVDEGAKLTTVGSVSEPSSGGWWPFSWGSKADPVTVSTPIKEDKESSNLGTSQPVSDSNLVTEEEDSASKDLGSSSPSKEKKKDDEFVSPE